LNLILRWQYALKIAGGPARNNQIEGVRDPKIRRSRAQSQLPNRAFRGLQNRPLETLKKGKKPPFIQQLAYREIALGAVPVSWHK
jgi:hypothetical protein